MMKRALSFLLALIMAFGLLPNTLVLATEPGDDIYIEDSANLSELEDLGVVDIPDDVPDVIGIPEDLPAFHEDAASTDDDTSYEEPSDPFLDHPEPSPLPWEPEQEPMEEEPVIIETPDPLPEVADDFRGYPQTGSGHLGGIFAGDMTVSYTTNNRSLVWEANGSGVDVDQTGAKIDTYEGYPYYNSATDKNHTIRIIPDAEAASVEGVTQLHINLYQIQIHNQMNLHIYLDPEEFAKYPWVTEVVIHSATPGRSLVLVDNSSLTLEGLPNCRLVLDGKQPDGTDINNKLVQIGYGDGVGNVKMDYVTFRNAPQSAILIAGGMMESITISNCKFESTCINTANDGGAIFCASYFRKESVNYSTLVEVLTVSNCTFEGNTATRSGGAVCLFGSFDLVQINNNTFTKTSVTGSDGRGGALALIGFYNQVTLSGNTYIRCTASQTGGGAIGICATVGELTVSDSFDKCSAKNGGAIYMTSDYLQASSFPHLQRNTNFYNRIGTLNITGSQFTGCSSTGHGGAVDLAVQASVVSVSNSSFTQCSTGGNGDGGGICFAYLKDLPNGFAWSSANWAEGTGLVLTAHNGAAFRDTVRNGSITTYGAVSVSNTAFNTCNGHNGGGLYVQQDTSVDSFTVTDVTLQSCTAGSYGGGIGLGSDAQNQTITLTDIDATSNQAGVSGAGVYIRARENNAVTITGGEYANNASSGTANDSGGGGIHVHCHEATDVSVSISNVTVVNNSTQSRGGGIYLYVINADAVSISDVTVRNNQSKVYGGGIYLYGANAGSISISGSTLSENKSEANGGGMYLIGRDAGLITVSHSTFANNQSHFHGGGMYLYSAPQSTSLTNLWIYGNVAGFGGGTNYGDGGGIYLTAEQASTVTLANSVIGAKLQNTTNENGETVQETVAAPNIAYYYIREKVVSFEADGETPGIDTELPDEGDETHETTKEYVGGGRGGGLAIMGVNLRLQGTKVLHNRSDYTGGGIAVYSAGTLTVSNERATGSEISHNTSARGGGMFIYGASVSGSQYALEMTQGAITHNRAYQTELNEGLGGGMVIYNAKAKLTGVNISNNVCAQLVNGAYVFEGQGITNHYGGGLAIYFESVVELYGCTVQANQAQAGGGIVMHRGSTLTMKPDANGVGNQVKQNISTGYGGGVYLRSRINVNKDGQSVTLRNTLTVENAVFSGNKAGTGDFGGNGGSICVMTGGQLEIINTEISSNEAQFGYEPQRDENDNIIYQDGNPLWIVATLKEQNPEQFGIVENAPKQNYGYGGGIACYGAAATIRGCKIHHNTSGRRGGGIYGESGSSIEIYNITAEDGTVITSHIHHNETRDYAGGIGAVGHIIEKRDDNGKIIKENNITVIDEQKSIRARLRLDGTLVEYNETKQQGGGGVYISSLAICDIVNQAVVQHNTAQSHGGGIMANIWGTVNVTDAQVISNNAGDNGGGAYISSHSEVVVTNGEINNNTASGHGGGVVASGTVEWGGCSVTITGGEICYNTASGHGGGVYAIGQSPRYQEYSSTVLINEGTMISNNRLTTENRDGGGVYVGQLSTVTIEGGQITENTASRYGGGVAGSNKATVTVAGGQIFQNDAGSAGGVYVGGESKIYVNDGLIKQNRATAIWQETTEAVLYGNGGGVLATDTAQIIITGGEITDNEAKSFAYYTNADGTLKSKEQTEICTVATKDGGTGGGVYATGQAGVLLEGGSVTLNDARFGGGICADDQATVTVQGGSVAENIASERGGGIYAGGAAKVTMEPKKDDDTSFGSIIGNSATLEGGGVYATGTAQVTLKKGNIQSNTAKDGGGIYAGGADGGSSVVTVDGGMIGGSEQNGVSVGNRANGGNGGGIYATDSAEVTVSGGQITDNHALKVNDSGGNGGGIYATITSGVLVNGGNVKQNQAVNGAGICSNNEATVTVQGGSVAENIASKRGGGIYAGGASKVTMEPKEDDAASFGSIIGNSATLEGGGVYAIGPAQVELTKGNIQSNTAKDGGGLYATGGAVVAVSGGQITDNHALKVNNSGGNGGGIYTVGVAGSPSGVTLTGGTISSNSADQYGGGVYIGTYGSVTVSGGELSSNTGNYGGGVFIYYGATMEVTTGMINNNCSTKAGGGIFMYADNDKVPTITVSGGEISGNIAQSGTGGGIYATGDDDAGVCSITVNEGLIRNNEAVGGNGGGIALHRSSVCTINGGTITGNAAKRSETDTAGYGGGVFMSATAKLTVNGGTIFRNQAYNGGGIYTTGDKGVKCTVQGGDITRNTAACHGGGIMVAGLSEVLIQGGIICENTAEEDGGGIYVGSTSGRATVTITKTTINGKPTVGEVKNNTADNGGGVYVFRGGELIVNEGHIINNTAVAPQNAKLSNSGKGLSASLHGAGGGICVASNDAGTAIFTLTGTEDQQTGRMNMAIYGNTATFSGDEVFSNGRNTSLTVPLVSQMNLDGYELDIVGWFEDYNTGDTSYTSGLNMITQSGGTVITDSAGKTNALRYRNSTADERKEVKEQYIDGIARDSEGKKIVLVQDDPGTPDVVETVYQMLPEGTQYVNLSNAYVAMALGIPNAADDTVVVDYGMSVQIDLLSNDMLLKSEGEGMNPKLDSKLGLALPGEVEDEKEILYSPLKKDNDQDVAADFKRYLTNDGASKISILNRGTAQWRQNEAGEETGVLIYHMDVSGMDQEEVFYYVVPGVKFYYYAAVTVVPATTIYYEDNCGLVTYHETSSIDTLGKWEPVSNDTGHSAQAQDRPGASSLLDSLDANNIYGYDGAYTDTETYSNGSAYKVTVGQHKATDQMNFNDHCDVFDEVKGNYCRRKVTHTYQDNGSGKCSVCLNTQDRHSSSTQRHECTDDNNHNEYCDICSRWIGMHITSARATFTFTGTGFDIISLCSAQTGVVMVNVYKGKVTNFDDPPWNDYVASYIVDTYFGYRYDSTNQKWVIDPTSESSLYQVPVIKADLTKVMTVMDDPNTQENEAQYKNWGYGTYSVEIYVAPGFLEREHAYWVSDFYLDAIRIYNPTGAGDDFSDAVLDAYEADAEAWPAYAEVRNMLIEAKNVDIEDQNGAIFVDGVGEKATLADYTSLGPNNEVYLQPGQHIAFTMDMENYGQDVKNIHMAMRGLTGKGHVLVQAGTGAGNKTEVLETALSSTDLYYDIGKDENGASVAGKVITITNPEYIQTDENTSVKNEAPIAITTIKVTHGAKPSVNSRLDGLFQSNLMTSYIALEMLNEKQLAEPSVTPKYPALSYNGLICYNVFFSAEDLGTLTADDLGLAVFDRYDPEGTVETARDVILGATQIDGLYMVATRGVNAKYLGDTQYFRAFAKKAEGSFVYSKMVSYSAVDYATNVLAKSNDVKLKQLVVAMLNYGAQAQKFFGYKTDDLMNKALTADHQALLTGFDADSLNSVRKADPAKVGSFASTGGFTRRSPAISFNGAFEINYFFTPAHAVDGDMTLYVWSEDTCNGVTELTAENADKAVVMTLQDGSYTAASDEIAAKYLDKTLYVAAVYRSNGETHCSGVLPYSIAAYCQKPPAGVQALATAAAVYGCAAKQFFS